MVKSEWKKSLGGLVVLLLTANVAWAEGEEGASDKSGNENVAAVVEGEAITMQELDDVALGSDMKLAQQLYDARQAALNELIMQRLLADEAKAAGVTVDQLVTQRIAASAPPITDAQVEAFYNANKSRMGGRSLEQISGQIRNYLASQQQSQARDTLLKQLKSEADVKVVLDAPRVNISVGPDEPSIGPADAEVTIVEYSDLECPFCARVVPTLDQIQEEYGDKVRIVFRDFPLGNHQRAIPAAEAALCAHDQDKFWEYHDKIFENQKSLADSDLKSYAEELELNMDEFNACTESNKYRTQIAQDQQRGQQLGVTGTPAFFVNGRFMSGAKPFGEFKKVIDSELAN